MKFPSPEEVAAAKKKKENEIRRAAIEKAAAAKAEAKKVAEEAAKKARENLENDVLEHLNAGKLKIRVSRECRPAVDGVLTQLRAEGWDASFDGYQITVTKSIVPAVFKLAEGVVRLFSR